MADVRPFRGLRYRLGRAADLSKEITPPYDVISPEQQCSFHLRSPHNIIRLEFGKDSPSDTPTDNKYRRAASTLKGWLKTGVLFQEERPAYYVVEHGFQYRGKAMSYRAIIGAVRLEELGAGSIRPTEITMKGPIADRLSLLESCRANVSPIMGVVDQEEGRLLALLGNATDSTPVLTAVDDNRVSFRLWVVSDEAAVRRIAAFFREEVIYIADGHHRYATAGFYRDQRASALPSCSGNEAFNYVMMALAGARGSGLSMLPVHRLVKGMDPEKMMGLRVELADHFHIEEMPPSSAYLLSSRLPDWLRALEQSRGAGGAFGLYGLKPGRFEVLVPRDIESLRAMLPQEKPLPWKHLDVSVLHWVVLRGKLGLDDPEKEKRALEYCPDEAEVARRVDAGEFQMAFFINPTPVSSVLAVGDAGARMPQKSSYFYPKTPAGLVINPLFHDVGELG